MLKPKRKNHKFIYPEDTLSGASERFDYHLNTLKNIILYDYIEAWFIDLFNGLARLVRAINRLLK